MYIQKAILGDNMNKEDCKRTPRAQRKTVQVTVRVTSRLSKWLKKEGLSPTRIFEKACEQLGFKK